MCHYLSQGTFPWPEEPLPDHVRVCVVIKIYTTWEFAPNITNLQRKSPNSCCRTFGLPMTKPSPTAPQIIKYGLSKSSHPSHWFDISSAWSLFSETLKMCRSLRNASVQQVMERRKETRKATARTSSSRRAGKGHHVGRLTSWVRQWRSHNPAGSAGAGTATQIAV